MFKVKFWIIILIAFLTTSPISVIAGNEKFPSEMTEHVTINDLVMWVEYSYDMNLSFVTLNFTIATVYYPSQNYYPNFYIEYAKFEVLDISSPLNEESGYVFNLTQKSTLYSPKEISTSLTVIPKTQPGPSHYIRVYCFLKFRRLESSNWTIATIPFTLYFHFYDRNNWWQLQTDNAYLKEKLSSSMILTYIFAITTFISLCATIFFGLQWRRLRKILESIK